MGIPFAADLRCLLDFAFSKSALDIFQFWQLFNWHIQLFAWKCGNSSYVEKIYGDEVEAMDYITGYLIMGVLLTIVIGPIVFFSEYAFIDYNPVQEADIKVALVISKKLSKNDLTKRSIWNWEENHNPKKK